MIFAHTILVDTSAYYALKDKDDAFHTNALQFVKTNTNPMATTNLIVIETLNLVKQRLGYQHAVEIGKIMFDPMASNVIKIAIHSVFAFDEHFRQYGKFVVHPHLS